MERESGIQNEIIEGRNAVIEALRAGRAIDKLFINTGTGLRDLPIQTSTDYCIDSLKKICAIAQTKGITMLLEQLQPYESNICHNIEQMKQIIQAVDSKALKICVDLTAMAVANETLDMYFETFGKEMIQLIQRLVIIALAAWIFLTKVLVITQAHGQNMFPSVKDGDLIIAFRLQGKYQKDDIVICTADGQPYIGRIAANENDVINMDETGALTVNGTAQTGEIIYPTVAKPGIEYPYRVPDDSVFLLGDYRSAAIDSRDFGPVPKKNVKGKVITILRRRQL